MKVNAQIIKTALGFSDKGSLGFEIVFSYLDEGQVKEISTNGIEINTLENIGEILGIIGANIWEDLRGKVVQLEYDEKGIISITNILDYRLILKFRVPEEIEENENE